MDNFNVLQQWIDDHYVPVATKEILLDIYNNIKHNIVSIKSNKSSFIEGESLLIELKGNIKAIIDTSQAKFVDKLQALEPLLADELSLQILEIICKDQYINKFIDDIMSINLFTKEYYIADIYKLPQQTKQDLLSLLLCLDNLNATIFYYYANDTIKINYYEQYSEINIELKLNDEYLDLQINKLRKIFKTFEDYKMVQSLIGE